MDIRLVLNLGFVYCQSDLFPLYVKETGNLFLCRWTVKRKKLHLEVAFMCLKRKKLHLEVAFMCLIAVH